jgi:outer membrane immunogenic protein
VAGGQAGCNYQWRAFVLGVEGELYWSSLKTTDAFDDPTHFDHSLEDVRNKWDATVALRGGWAIDRALFFGKLGVAWSRFDFLSESQCCNVNSPLITDTGSATLPGLLLGVGFEYAIWHNWTGKIEYDYINYGTPTISFLRTSSNGSAPSTFTESERQNKQIVKFGLNYMFR